MRTIVRWCNWSGDGLDHCVLKETDQGLRLDGVVAGVEVESGDAWFGGAYQVETDASFRTREVRLHYTDGPVLQLCSDGEGNWRDQMRNEPIAALEGCIDVDIAMTPATNVLPIRRLNLFEGESKIIRAAFIPLPIPSSPDLFRPHSVEQRYTCLSPMHRYGYEGLDSGFTAELDVDVQGMVIDYPNSYRRLRLGSASHR